MFRKEAVDQLSSPETLDEDIRLVSPGNAIAAVAATVVAVAALLWSVFGSLPLSASGPGLVRASTDSIAAVTAPVSGEVVAILVRPGETVGAGDPLMTVNVGALDRAIEEEHDEVRFLERYIDALTGGTAGADAAAAAEDTPRAVLAAVTEAQRRLALVEAEARLQEHRDRLDRLLARRADGGTVRAVAPGTVVRTLATEGDTVHAGEALLVLADAGHTLVVTAYVPFRDRAGLAPGIAATVLAPGGDSRGVLATGKIRSVGTVVDLPDELRGASLRGGQHDDAATDYSLVLVALDPGPSPARVRPGDHVEVRLALGRRAPLAVLVPSLAPLFGG